MTCSNKVEFATENFASLGRPLPVKVGTKNMIISKSAQYELTVIIRYQSVHNLNQQTNRNDFVGDNEL